MVIFPIIYYISVELRIIKVDSGEKKFFGLFTFNIGRYFISNSCFASTTYLGTCFNLPLW